MNNKFIHQATFCEEGAFCPKLYINESAEEAKKVVITDDYGQKVEMSHDQFQSFVEQAKAGKLDIE